MEFIFKHIDPLAVLVFIFATLAVTEGLKYILAKSLRFCAMMEIGFFKICLSWIVGAMVFVILHLTLKTFPVTEGTVIQFMIWVTLLNGGYKIVASLLDYIKDLRAKV